MNDTKAKKLLKTYLYLTVTGIVAPMLVLVLWAFANRWPWPNLLPATYSLRSINELLGPHVDIFRTMVSSILLSFTVAVSSAFIGTITARALALYDFKGKRLIGILSILPILIPGTVFAMGIHVVFIRLSLADTVLGVIIVHLIYTLPYSVNIMKDLTESIGNQMEVQGSVLGASPLKAFFHITLPLLRPGIITSATMAYIVSFSQYFLTLLIGGGKVKTISLLMVPFISKGDRSIGSAYALLFMISTLLIFIIMDRAMKRLPYQVKRGELR